MSETAPVVAPDLSAGTLNKSITEVTTAANPFIPANVRAGIYTVGGLVIVVAGAAAPIVGGVVGNILDGISAAAGALVGTLAVSHVK